MSEKRSLLDGDSTASDDDAPVKKKQPPIRKESPVSFRQLVNMLFIHTLILVSHSSSFAMLIELIISCYSSACVLL
jgi:hypothetical protein